MGGPKLGPEGSGPCGGWSSLLQLAPVHTLPPSLPRIRSATRTASLLQHVPQCVSPELRLLLSWSVAEQFFPEAAAAVLPQTPRGWCCARKASVPPSGTLQYYVSCRFLSAALSIVGRWLCHQERGDKCCHTHLQFFLKRARPAVTVPYGALVATAVDYSRVKGRTGVVVSRVRVKVWESGLGTALRA